ncbi:hypothetical protein POG14_11030 [Clostridium paraputrificum]|uniref:hypothetical protein n=2 Tax=Clostridium paraputrificum TaxID=29363 RepID=UPI001A9B89F7|nr:hypothetical protein [Clostridium paraputrificum]MDC0802720.1 hypothetical protein [Clostridium paraputrificum]
MVKIRIYKIYSQCQMGFEGDIEYKKSINTATQYFNNLIRKTLKEVEVVDKDDFSDNIAEFRENIENWHKDREIICRKYPILIYKDKNKTIAVIDYWSKTSYEYNEYDIESEQIILEEINIVD